jgi:hypothetical protein
MITVNVLRWVIMDGPFKWRKLTEPQTYPSARSYQAHRPNEMTLKSLSSI